MASKKNTVQGIEIIDDEPVIETVAESRDFSKLAADEAFMNELVTVMVHATTDENQPNHVVVKRKYVEILARMKETKYTQVTRNASAPDQIDMVARHGLSYPFDLVEDKNPRGRAWLQNVLAEAA
jgi:disulfide oxidoreductase YuzD